LNVLIEVVANLEDHPLPADADQKPAQEDDRARQQQDDHDHPQQEVRLPYRPGVWREAVQQVVQHRVEWVVPPDMVGRAVQDDAVNNIAGDARHQGADCVVCDT